MFWWLKLGLISVWGAIAVVFLAVSTTFYSVGDIEAAMQTVCVFAFLFVVWASYKIGFFRGVTRGKAMLYREFQHQAGLDERRYASVDTILDSTVEEMIADISMRRSGAQLLPNGKTAKRLNDAIAYFPSVYPNFKQKPPKLDDDIRPWLKSQFNTSEREAHVFGAIIAEHFEL